MSAHSKPIYGAKRDHCESDFYVTKNGVGMVPADVQAEVLNLLTEIRDALAVQGEPGKILRQTRRAWMEQDIGSAEREAEEAQREAAALLARVEQVNKEPTP